MAVCIRRLASQDEKAVYGYWFEEHDRCGLDLIKDSKFGELFVLEDGGQVVCSAFVACTDSGVCIVHRLSHSFSIPWTRHAKVLVRYIVSWLGAGAASIRIGIDAKDADAGTMLEELGFAQDDMCDKMQTELEACVQGSSQLVFVSRKAWEPSSRRP